jgi:hypothetical protein
MLILNMLSTSTLAGQLFCPASYWRKAPISNKRTTMKKTNQLAGGIIRGTLWLINLIPSNAKLPRALIHNS